LSLEGQLYTIERELANGGGAAYRRHLTDDAIVIVPGRCMDKRETVEAMHASAGWDAWSFDAERMTKLAEDSALLTYRFGGERRGGFRYRALMASLYLHQAGVWHLAFHQQTPL
jgi:hypothetical protein